MGDTNFIESYVHNGGIGVLVELGAPNSAAARSDTFTRLARDLAIHIAAMAPASTEELLQQPSVMAPDKLVGQIIADVASELGGKIVVSRFVRWIANPQEPDPPRSPAVILKSVG